MVPGIALGSSYIKEHKRKQHILKKLNRDGLTLCTMGAAAAEAAAWSFTPSDSPVGDFSADAITGLEDGDVIGTWPNNGSGADAIQGTATNKPTYESAEADLLNGEVVVNFADSDYMDAAITLANELITLYAVFKTDGGNDKFLIGSNSTTPYSSLTFGPDNGDMPLCTWKNTCRSLDTGGVNPAAGSWYIGAVTMDGSGDAVFYLNSSSGNAGGSTCAGENNWTVRLSPEGYRSIHGRVATFLIYDSLLTGTDLTDNITGLNTKYAVY